ncbi:MAG TPA: nucleoside triphosphate pyrophosphohydrolase family protein [bacterium]|jgi:NTP pyrophosphatase (non-canonical NTP hydrolase)|nr:nucleoside triphosphate pyrophosphohydrolase family protein [bacterium]HOQ91374.1 nucleoside triphosphate pyrophosphohydrolase family protein [bacterium]HPL22211.1 nucleoside triphosphate pyrophosphohydrolase family protein [bacterium]
MEFKEYQQQSHKTAVYPVIGQGFVYPALGLAGESGEVVEKIKKIFRDQQGIVGDEQRQAVAKELGDVLWYLAQLATELDLDLNQVAQDNLDKLFSRQQRGQLHGSGDER